MHREVLANARGKPAILRVGKGELWDDADFFARVAWLVFLLPCIAVVIRDKQREMAMKQDALTREVSELRTGSGLPPRSATTSCADSVSSRPCGPSGGAAAELTRSRVAMEPPVVIADGTTIESLESHPTQP